MDENEQPNEPPNWADVACILMSVPLGFAQVLVRALAGITGLFAARSQTIDARKRFEREARESIESLASGTE